MKKISLLLFCLISFGSASPAVFEGSFLSSTAKTLGSAFFLLGTTIYAKLAVENRSVAQKMVEKIDPDSGDGVTFYCPKNRNCSSGKVFCNHSHKRMHGKTLADICKEGNTCITLGIITAGIAWGIQRFL